MYYDKKNKEWIVLYANETKAQEFDNKKEAREFYNYVNPKRRKVRSHVRKTKKGKKIRVKQHIRRGV